MRIGEKTEVGGRRWEGGSGRVLTEASAGAASQGAAAAALSALIAPFAAHHIICATHRMLHSKCKMPNTLYAPSVVAFCSSKDSHQLEALFLMR